MAAAHSGNTSMKEQEQEHEQGQDGGLAPVSMAEFMRGHRRPRPFRTTGVARVAENGAYLHASAAAAAATAVPSVDDEDDVPTFHNLFEDAPVFRSAAGAAPADMTQAATVTAASLVAKAAAPVFAVAAQSAEAVVLPALPHPYVLSHQCWTVPASVPVMVVVEALTAAFQSLDVDATFFTSSAEFKCAATMEFRSMRFTARLFKHNGTCVEFQLNTGGSMEYHQLYAAVIAALPPKVAAACHIATPARRTITFCPPPLDAEAPTVARLDAGDVAPLVRMAQSGMRQLQRDAAAALLEFSTCAANAATLVNDGVLAAMAALIAASHDWATVQAAVSVVANVIAAVFAPSHKQAAPVVDSAVTACGAVVAKMLAEVRERAQGIVAADSSAQQALRRECCRALACMTMNKTLLSAVAAAGGADVLSTAAGCRDQRESAFAASAMAHLVTACA